MSQPTSMLEQARAEGYQQGAANARMAHYEEGYEEGRREALATTKHCRGCWLMLGYFIGAITYWLIT